MAASDYILICLDCDRDFQSAKGQEEPHCPNCDGQNIKVKV